MPGSTYIADTDGARALVLEGLTLLFHPQSGTTHILAPPSPEILDALRDAPGDAGAVVARLRDRFDLPAEDAEAAVAARLAELAASGLVRPL